MAHHYNTPKDEYLAWTASKRFWDAFPAKQPEPRKSLYFYAGLVTPAIILLIALGMAIHFAVTRHGWMLVVPW